MDEPDGLGKHWKEYSGRDTASPNIWMDAYLAAFARAAGYQLITTDSGFRQFRNLDLVVLGDEA
jgi:predicted nucleic acid-binding protein